MSKPYDATFFITLGSAFLSCLSIIRAKMLYKREMVTKALNDLIDASTETNTYLEHIQSGGKSDRMQELKLAKLWEHASVSTKDIDEKLSNRLYKKGDIWRNPEDWPDYLIQDVGLSLNGIMKEAKYILYKQ